MTCGPWNCAAPRRPCARTNSGSGRCSPTCATWCSAAAPKGQDRFGYDREGSIIYGRDAPKLTGAVDGDNFALDVWYESIHPDDRPAYEAAERRRKEEGRDFSLDYRLIHPVTGELRWMRETAWVVEDPETGQTFFDSYILDITDERRIADQLREAKTEAERASRAKSEFLANMSHEIRTPLNAILGFSEAMRMEIFGPMGNARYADYAGHICDSAEHLLSLINDLLDLSKVEAGKLELEETAIDPAAVVEEACRLVSAAAADNGVALLRRLPDQSPALWGDRRLVRQVLLNLLTNAVKFTPAAGRVTVSVSTEEDGRPGGPGRGYRHRHSGCGDREGPATVRPGRVPPVRMRSGGRASACPWPAVSSKPMAAD